MCFFLGNLPYQQDLFGIDAAIRIGREMLCHLVFLHKFGEQGVGDLLDGPVEGRDESAVEEEEEGGAGSEQDLGQEGREDGEQDQVGVWYQGNIFFKVFEYIPDLVPSCQKALVKKIAARNNCHFYKKYNIWWWREKLVILIKITVSGSKTTIFYLLGTYNERL